MYFGLTDERKLLQATLRELVARELPPARLRRCFDDGGGFDAELWHAAAVVEAGLLQPDPHAQAAGARSDDRDPHRARVSAGWAHRSVLRRESGVHQALLT